MCKCNLACVSRCVGGEQSKWSPVPGSSQWGLVPVAEPASLPAGRGTAHTPQPQPDRSLPGNTHSCQSVFQLLAADQCTQICNMIKMCVWPRTSSLCVCRTCYPWLEIPPREQPTTTSRTLLTLACSHPSLSNTLPSITLPLRTGLMFAYISCCLNFFYVAGSPTHSWCAARWMSGCTCHSHTYKHTQSTNV